MVEYAEDPGRGPVHQYLPLGDPFTFRDALGFGVSETELRTLVRVGVVRRVFRGVYIDSMAPDSQRVRALAIGKVISPTSVVTDEAAGWLHMIDLDPPGARMVAPDITVFETVPGARLRRLGAASGERALLDRDVDVVNGVNVTTRLRTALDLGRLRHRDQAFASVEALFRSGAFTKEDLLRELPRFRGMRYVVQLRDLVTLVDARAQSAPESIIRLRCLDHGLPALEPQMAVRDPDTGARAFLDLGNDDLKFAVEFDGRAWHEGARAEAHDARRRAWLRRLGWRIVVLTGGDVYGVPREHTVQVIRRALDAHRPPHRPGS
ncbi:MAG: type IV toxin-antitoxin system AbiEi family antitoxin domain-containing protein [Nocardioides sp.]